LKFGLLLPHFGSSFDREQMFVGARRAEEVGFDSLWVRDHLVFTPHGEFEDPSRIFLDSLTTLTAIGAVTNTIGLGTAALVPFRHPIQTAVVASSITHLVGDRLLLGVGTGSGNEEFEALGLGGIDRSAVSVEYIQVLRELLSGTETTHKGPTYRFAGVRLEPAPHSPIPLWYCGNTPLSVRRAVADCDGWLPGRLGIATLAKRVGQLRELSGAQGRPMPTVGIVPPTVVTDRREDAIALANVEGLVAWANRAKFWVKPSSGRFEGLADLGGVLLAGTPEDIVDGCAALGEAGAELVVFDFRLSFDRWLEQVEMIGEIVLPALSTTAAPRSGSPPIAR
jgi:alkanesulfonate monooxygenase SsuD/methylene tetrahydromethanopterin reductase-like flavin-dependent oxidoreductase (luciferase family)